MGRVASFVARLCWTILIVALAACQKGAPPPWPDAEVVEPDKIVATSEPGWHSKIAYPICIVSASENKTIAQAFVDFIMGPEGQAVLKSKGFLPAPAQ